MRKRMYEIIEKAQEKDRISHIYDWYIMGIALLSVLPLMVHEMNPTWRTLETWTVYLLFLDYIMRWMTYDYHIKKHSVWAFVTYPITPLAVMDMLAILPSINLLPQGFMILRLLRLTKILQYSTSFTYIMNVFRKEGRTLFSVLMIAIFYIFVSALVMFVHESAETFPTFFDALYWATTALTTVGYGDVYPHTQLGKLISMISSLFGVAIIAMPAGIVTGGFLEELNLHKKKGREEEKDEQ